jgi:hypothetical protein
MAFSDCQMGMHPAIRKHGEASGRPRVKGRIASGTIDPTILMMASIMLFWVPVASRYTAPNPLPSRAIIAGRCWPPRSSGKSRNFVLNMIRCH